MNDLKPYFNGAVLLNATAAKDEAIMAMLEDQHSKGWPVASGFGPRYTWRELAGVSPRFNS